MADSGLLEKFKSNIRRGWIKAVEDFRTRWLQASGVARPFRRYHHV